MFGPRSSRPFVGSASACTHDSVQKFWTFTQKFWTLSKLLALKNLNIQQMSFLKIKDPKKKDALVAEFLKTKNKIKNDFPSERIGEQSIYEDFGKIFKPITEQQKPSSAAAANIVSKLEPLLTAIESISALPQEAQDELEPFLPNTGEIAKQYLRKSRGKEADKTFGLEDRDGQLYLGNAKVAFDGDDLLIKGKRYLETPGVGGLIVMKEPKADYSMTLTNQVE